MEMDFIGPLLLLLMKRLSMSICENPSSSIIMEEEYIKPCQLEISLDWADAIRRPIHYVLWEMMELSCQKGVQYQLSKDALGSNLRKLTNPYGDTYAQD